MKSNELLTCDKVQLVTGYAAIPAGTTIEYLGKLGDKARVQVVSYVGTGAYGSDNPTTIKFDIAPKILLISCTQSDDDSNVAVVNGGWLKISFSGRSARPGWLKFDGKNVSLYAQSNSMYYNARSAYNHSGWKYTAIAIS